MSDIVPDRKNDLLPAVVLTCDQPIEFPTRPPLGKEAGTQDDDAEPRLAQAAIDRPPQAVANAQAELVVPDLDMLSTEPLGRTSAALSSLAWQMKAS